MLPQNTNGLDADGSSVPWHLVGGTTSPLPLGCDLDGDCVDWFYPHLGAFIIAPGSAGVIDPHTRTAHLFASEGSGSELKLDVDMFGSGPNVDDTEPLYGMAEYTWLECGESVCPFYLANLSAYNTTDTWDIRVDVGNTRIEKQISNVQIDLVQSTSASRTWRSRRSRLLRARCAYPWSSPSDARTATPRATVPLSRSSRTRTTSLRTTTTVRSRSSTRSISSRAARGRSCSRWSPGSFPPWRSTISGRSRPATIRAAWCFSTDPDSDVAFEMWWVDGVPLGHGAVVPLGQHTVSLEVHDSRGAVHRSADHDVTVVQAAPC